MEFNHIIALVPEGEYFDASAVNEGVWVSTAHLNNIEASLANAGTLVQQANDQVTATLALLDDAALASQQQADVIAAKDETIASLTAEIATMKQQPAAPITQTVKEKDEKDIKVVEESEITKEARRLREMRKRK